MYTLPFVWLVEKDNFLSLCGPVLLLHLSLSLSSSTKHRHVQNQGEGLLCHFFFVFTHGGRLVNRPAFIIFCMFDHELRGGGKNDCAARRVGVLHSTFHLLSFFF